VKDPLARVRRGLGPNARRRAIEDAAARGDVDEVLELVGAVMPVKPDGRPSPASMTTEELEAEFTTFVGFLLEEWLEAGRYTRSTPLGTIVDELELERADAVDRRHNEGRPAARRLAEETHARRDAKL
jgi:hypothetical protein